MNTVTFSNLSAADYSRLFAAQGAAACRVTVPSDGIVSLHWSPGGEDQGLKLFGSLDPMALAAFFGSFYMKWLTTVCKAVTEQNEQSFMHMLQTGLWRSGIASEDTAVGLLMEEMGNVSPSMVQEYAMLTQDTPDRLGCLEKLSMGVCYIDNDFRIRWANETASRLGDDDLQEKYGQLCYEQITGQVAPCDDCPVVQTLEDGRLHASEKTMPWGDIWNLISVPAFDKNGRQLVAIEVVSDITAQVREHKQATELLRHQQERLRTKIEIIKYLQAHYAMDGVDFMTSPEAVTEAVAHTLESSAARFWIREKNGFRCLDCYNSLDGMHRKNISAPLPVLDFFWLHINPKGLVPIADVLEADLPEEVGEYYLSQGARAVLFSPKRIRARFLGFTTIVRSTPHAWMPEEQSFAMAIADFVALCLNQHSLDEHRRRVHTPLSNLPGAAFRMRYGDKGVVVEFLSEGSVNLCPFLERRDGTLNVHKPGMEKCDAAG